MNIVVNTRLLLSNRLEGIGWFTYETLKRITQDHPEHKFVFIFDRKYSEEFIFSKNILPVIADPPAKHPVLWSVFFEWSVPKILEKYKADLFLSTDGFLSLKTKTKSLNVIHDINFVHFPNFNPWIVNKYYDYYFPKFVKKATRIATVSEFSRDDISSHFGVDPGKIDVVYNGANEELKPASLEIQDQTRKKHTNGSPYFLFIGLIQPRKNIDNLIKAFDEFKQEVTNNVKLLIVGSKKYWNEEIQNAYNESIFQDDIIFTGRIESDELRLVIASALTMVYASHFEGFGVPILEAMYCDIPVITSKVTSMPEVGGNAALYVEPSSIDSIKDAMLKIFCDTNIRGVLIKKSRIQREKYTWDRTASLLWTSIEKCLKE